MTARVDTGGASAAAPAAGGTVASEVLRFVRDDLGCDRLFTVPGEAFLPLLGEAGAAGVRIVTARHEAGAGFAAIADARLRGGPSMVAVNRAPGATNVSIALEAARADPTPVLCVVGGVRRGADPRTGFQATDPARVLGGLAPTVTVADAAALPRALRAVGAALTGAAGGPAVLVVPEEVWDGPAPPRPASPAAATGGGRRPSREATERAAARVHDVLRAVERPVLVAGRLLRAAGGAPEPGPLLSRLSRRAAVPVLAGNKQQDLLDNRDAGYAGHLHLGTAPATRRRLAEAEAVAVLGDLPDEVHLAGWYDRQRLLAVHPDPAGPGEALAGDPAAVLRALADLPWPAAGEARRAWLAGWRGLEDGLARAAPRPRPDGIDFTAVAAALDAHLPGDAVLVLDAGNFSSWVHRYVRLRGRQRLLALAGGAMGFGVPGAVGAVLRAPDRPVVAVTGDGGLLMTGSELATARAAGRAPVVVVADNASYGTIRAHEARRYPHAACGTALANPDLVAWAASFGLPGELVERPEQVDAAVRRALAAPDGYLLHVRTSLEAVHANFDLPAGPGHAAGGTVAR